MEISENKIEILRQALPRGLSAGDSGLGDLPQKSIQPAKWPAYSASSILDTKLYSRSPDSIDTFPPAKNPKDIYVHPWKVYLRINNDGNYEYKIEYSSKIYNGFSSYAITEITGLDEWTSASNGFLYLEATVETLSISKAEIKGPSETIGDRITFSEDNQSKFTVPIAYIYDDEAGAKKIRQLAFHNFTIANMCIDGKPAICAFAA